ncbi:Major facilitator superfamily [Lasiodiplodia theobromae]|uniref:MFS transporter n=1 Tax=Lasiodiplodia theobromae TaxID=45133 RepID=UPI0015C3E454|nr:MFS transporter [Lasiodiplodia theobromae]KAF4546744.1 MFS transporter [Lasiodiplodia theobromae]KAF9632153.1 Major facilitator superfamily [Lasiodiplodia theobromae]
MDPENANGRSGYDDQFPPGTTRIEDSIGDAVYLRPSPTSDPNDPLNWSKGRKALQVTLLSFYTIFVFATLTVGVPVWTNINMELGISFDNLTNSFATNLAALSIGCWLFVPIALRYGRRPVYIVTSLILFGVSIWAAEMQSTGELFATQFLAGIAGAVNETLYQVTVADLFFVHQRGSMNGIYLWCVTAGNYLAPVAAGYVGASQGWRWVYWWTAIFTGVISVLMFFFLEETRYIPLIEGISVRNGNPVVEPHEIYDDNIKLDDVKLAPATTENSNLERPETAGTSTQRRRLVPIDHSIPMNSYWTRHRLISTKTDHGHSIIRHYWQPFAVLFSFPAISFTAFQYGIAISCLSILATTQSTLYVQPPYLFSSVGVGNMNLPPAIGSIIGAFYGGYLVDKLILVFAKKRGGGIYDPEMRLWLYFIPGLILPFGILLYGLTIAKGMPWISNAMGAAFVGFGVGGVGDITLTYAQDSYTDIVGDAFVAIAFIRNLLAMALVFALPPWLQGMGPYDMFTLLGCLTLTLSLTAAATIIWGKQWRAASKERYKWFAARQYSPRSA